ncbi:MAG: [Fe-Fe] hydrogenase large subunit C-terminal domain-containing protein [Clostridia bacterium]
MNTLRPLAPIPMPSVPLFTPCMSERRRVRFALEEAQTAVAFSLMADARLMLAAHFGGDTAAMEQALHGLGAVEVCCEDCYHDDLAHAEAAEFLQRFDAGLPLPQMIHACPQWLAQVRKEHPHYLPYFSQAKPRPCRQGLAVRARVCARHGLAPEHVAHVTVVGCPARKAALLQSGVDPRICGGAEYVLTARDVLCALVKKGMLPSGLTPAVAHPCAPQPQRGRLQEVLAHALLLNDGIVPAPDFLSLRPSLTHAGCMEGSITLDGREQTVATVRGAEHALALLQSKPAYVLVEVLTCACGCR